MFAARAIAVPMAPAFPPPELQYIVEHSEAVLLVASDRFTPKAQEVLALLPEKTRPALRGVTKHQGSLGGTAPDSSSTAVVTLEDLPPPPPSGDKEGGPGQALGAGMMLYTSGTTNRPKGVLLPERVLTAQCRSLLKAWHYSANDRLLHVLPLHHIHGTVNALLAPLFAGSSIEFMFPFNADAVWRRFAAPFVKEEEADVVVAPETSKEAIVEKSAAREREEADDGPAAKKRRLEVVTDGNTVQAVAVPVTNGASAPPPTPATAVKDANGIVAHLQHLDSGVSSGVSSATISSPSTPYHNGSPTSPINGASQPATVSSSTATTPPPLTATTPAARQRPVPITFFTVVPTVYNRLLATHKHLEPPSVQAAAATAIRPEHLRLCISGSAALPTPIKAAWTALSGGNVLLERYGMTEVGMALSCGLAMPEDRVDGSVGWPLPGVQCRLVDLETGEVVPESDALDFYADGTPVPGKDGNVEGERRERPGEIQLRGPGIFAQYWRNPSATQAEFIQPVPDDGMGPWFKTGDVAVRRRVVATPSSGIESPGSGRSGSWARGPLFFIQGRRSADIIKSGGEKVSALEVERELLSLPPVAEAAVVAVPSGKWGQKVGAVVVLDPEWVKKEQEEYEKRKQEGEEGGRRSRSPRRHGKPGTWTPLDMRKALRGRLVNYKIPQVLRVVDHIPRNAMGKINKKVLVRDVFMDDFSGDEAGL